MLYRDKCILESIHHFTDDVGFIIRAIIVYPTNSH